MGLFSKAKAAAHGLAAPIDLRCSRYVRSSINRTRAADAAIRCTSAITGRARSKRCLARSGLVLITGSQHLGSQEAFGSHHIEDESPIGLLSVEDPARRLDNLPVSPSSKLRRLRSASRMIDELIDVMKDTLHQRARRVRIL
jgi:hypothetical protein